MNLKQFTRDKLKLFLTLQAAMLFVGNIVGWTTVFTEVNSYCSGATLVNPLASPCFYGSLAFLASFVWTMFVLFKKDTKKIVDHAKKLWLLLLAGTIFAAVNNVPIIYNFYTQPASVGCSGNIITNPFTTGCFMGFTCFLLAFLFASFAVRTKK